MKFYLISPPFEQKNFNKDIFDKITDIINVTHFQIRPKYEKKEQNRLFAEKSLINYKKLCQKKKITFLLNDDVYLCKKLGYDGVHLGQKDMCCKQAREILGNDSVVGISCKNKISLAKKAKDEGADYVAFGPVYSSRTKTEANETLDIDIITSNKDEMSLPFTLIGGINHENIFKILRTGAMNFSVIDSIWNFREGPIKSALYFKKIRNKYEN